MNYRMIIKVLLSVCLVVFVLDPVKPELPRFRILAPEFVCPKDENTPLDKPDDTVITIQTPAGSTFKIEWTVRWVPLVAPTQRFTLLVWRTVRALEKRLNAPQPEPFVYVIPNDELLIGVNYVFNVTAVESDGESSTPKSFHIDNTQGDTKLDLVEGRADLLYVVLVGSQTVYADKELLLDAQVTSCFHTQDYYFNWSVRSTGLDHVVDVSGITGSRLTVPPNSLLPGLEYDADCQVIKQSTGLRLTQTGLPFQVLYRGLKVYLNIDYIIIPVNQPFYIEPIVINPDYYNSNIEYFWECTSESRDCENFESTENATLVFPVGLVSLGVYQIKLIVSVSDQTAEASAIIKTIEHTLPVIQVTSVSRLLNERSIISLTANASNVAPTCTLTWYFATEAFLASFNEIQSDSNSTEHGVALSDTLTIFSLEENFLTELADFTNETEWRQVSGEMEAKAGRARFVAECGCSITFECETRGIVYADITFKLNEAPKAGRVKIVPDSGTALETIFRISTLAAMDPDIPLKYSFFCGLGNDEVMLLGSYNEHLAVETFLPYIESGTNIWVEVCDSLGACSNGNPTTVSLSKGDGATIDTLIEDFKGHIRRCDMIDMQRLAMGCITSYIHADQQDLFTKFSAAILEALPPKPKCMQRYAQEYTSFLHWLATHGVDSSSLEGSS